MKINNKLIRFGLIVLCIPVVIGCWIVMLIPMMVSLYRNLNKLVMNDIDSTAEYMEFKRR